MVPELAIASGGGTTISAGCSVAKTVHMHVMGRSVG